MCKNNKENRIVPCTRTIILDISEKEYAIFMENNEYAKELIDMWIVRDSVHKLFPEAIFEEGYILKGTERQSKKTGFKKRRIQVGGVIYRIHPAFLASYMRGKTADMKWGLFLMRFGVPFWAIAMIFGKYAMFWYRWWVDFGRNSVIGTTLHSAQDLPENILCDEEHTYVRGKKAYIATTVSQGCLLGAEVVSKADEEQLKGAYEVAAQEMWNVNPKHEVKTSNTDGWAATQAALRAIYNCVIVQCFLHAFIKVRRRQTKKNLHDFIPAADRIWNAYRTETLRAFAQQIRRLKEWAIEEMSESPMKNKVLELCKKAKLWKTFYTYQRAYRTSNMLDRIMKLMKKSIKNAQYFHANNHKATLYMRAFALIYNFSPSSPLTIKRHNGKICPAQRISNLKYSDDWCINLMVSTSLRGYRC